MRIGLFTNNYRPLVNGLATSVDTFASAFRKQGHHVVVVAPRYPGGADESGVLRVPGFRAPTHHAYVLPLPQTPGLARAVARLDLDIFHAQHPYLLGPAAARWARRAGKPLVFTYHTRYERYAHYLPGPARWTAWLALRRALAFANQADLVVVPARTLVAELQHQGVRRRIAVVPTGVWLGPAAAAATDSAHLGLQTAGPLCLAVGRLAPEKNQSFLLHAFARLLGELPSARLSLVGEGDDRTRLERLARGLGIQAAVRFHGSVPHEAVGDYYRAADLFLFPSTSETQGLVILEALAAGLPVAAVASPASLEVLRDGETGLILPEDPAAFARGVTEAWRRPDRGRGLGEQGRRVAAAYTAEACAARLLDLYRELVPARQPDRLSLVQDLR
ncbi:MAG TPA: glycosyltransferase [Candidatus Sulfotelmatobacter sp.]|nr:glycosyltransferase [Candidatus Sulfotelmatobacter sp.]